MKNKKSLIAVLAIASTLLTGLSANAAGFSAAADRTANLAIAGDTVNVTLTGVPAEQGVYVRLCQGTLAEVATARPATPPTHAAYDRPIAAKVSPLNEITIPRAEKARTNSRTPKITATATTIAKISR